MSFIFFICDLWNDVYFLILYSSTKWDCFALEVDRTKDTRDISGIQHRTKFTNNGVIHIPEL